MGFEDTLKIRGLGNEVNKMRIRLEKKKRKVILIGSSFRTDPFRILLSGGVEYSFTNFATFSLVYVLTYPIILVLLDFVS